jgi:hypothetical protein
VDNIKMDLREIGWDGMGSIDMTQDRDHWRDLVNTCYSGKNQRYQWKANSSYTKQYSNPSGLTTFNYGG